MAIDAGGRGRCPACALVITAATSPNGVPRYPCCRCPYLIPMGLVAGVLADDKVRYVGEPIAFVVAESPAIAEDAVGPGARTSMLCPPWQTAREKR